MVTVTALPGEAVSLLDQARSVGFDRLIYNIDLLDGEIDMPIELMEHGFAPDYVNLYLDRIRQDPLRRMAARGEIDVFTPIVFENDGRCLSIARDRRLTAGNISLLRWSLSQGLRTGISFRIRLPRGRGASLNFSSAHSHTQRDLETAIERLFLIGHQIHNRLEPRLSRRYDRLLSERETECLEWIALGKSNREIADLLGLSLDTVKEHVHTLFQKLNVHGRAQAVSRGHMLAYLG